MSIQLENVSYTYGVGTPFEKTALRNVTMEISSGDFVGIIGHTGSGKSTLVQLLNGLLHPTMGQVTVNGMGWWAASFPSMAFTNGVLHFSNDYTVFWTRALGLFLLICATSLILWLSGKTIWAIHHKTLWKLY